MQSKLSIIHPNKLSNSYACAKYLQHIAFVVAILLCKAIVILRTK